MTAQTVLIRLIYNTQQKADLSAFESLNQRVVTVSWRKWGLAKAERRLKGLENLAKWAWTTLQLWVKWFLGMKLFGLTGGNKSFTLSHWTTWAVARFNFRLGGQKCKNNFASSFKAVYWNIHHLLSCQTKIHVQMDSYERSFLVEVQVDTKLIYTRNI